MEIFTICPKGLDSPATRRRSRSEFRCWPSDSPTEKTAICTTTILDDSRRRARSELRGWSSSNSSDEDLLGEFRSIPTVISNKDQPVSRAWGCSESSEGSDDSLPWGGVCRSSVDTVDSRSVPLPEPETREQRIQRYKEARRRENEARSRRILEEDARRRARAEENNNNLPKIYGRTRSRICSANDNDDARPTRSPKKELVSSTDTRRQNENSIIDRLPPLRPNESSTVRFITDENDRNEDDKRNNNNSSRSENSSPGILKTDINERRSRARERRIFRDKGQLTGITIANVETLRERKERLALLSSRIPVPRQLLQPCLRSTDCPAIAFPVSPPVLTMPPCEEDVAKLLERCQRVDHYVPVREKLTLFESLSRLGGRLARSTEDLGRTSSNPSPRGKQRARSLHDLNRGARALPVREMCRFFEGELEQDACQKTTMTFAKTRFSDPPAKNTWRDPSLKHEAPCISASARKKHYLK